MRRGTRRARRASLRKRKRRTHGWANRIGSELRLSPRPEGGGRKLRNPGGEAYGAAIIPVGEDLRREGQPPVSPHGDKEETAMQKSTPRLPKKPVYRSLSDIRLITARLSKAVKETLARDQERAPPTACVFMLPVPGV